MRLVFPSWIRVWRKARKAVCPTTTLQWTIHTTGLQSWLASMRDYERNG